MAAGIHSTRGGRHAQEAEIWVWPGLGICGPSNGRHKTAQDRPVFFAMLRSLPGAIDVALDTLSLYKPNAVVSQFLESASMTSCLFLLFLSFLSFPFSFFRFLVFSFFFFILFSLLFFSFFQLTCVCRAYA